jgi:hypothetical protein
MKQTLEQKQVTSNLVDYFQNACESSLIVPSETHTEESNVVLEWNCHKPVRMVFTVRTDGTTEADIVLRHGCTFAHVFTNTEALAINRATFLPAGIISCIRDLR